MLPRGSGPPLAVASASQGGHPPPEPLPRSWIFDRPYEILGTAFRIRSDDPSTARHVGDLLKPFRGSQRPRASDQHLFSLVSRGLSEDGYRKLYGGDRLVYRTEHRGSLLNRLMAELNIRALEGVPDLACHAGVVSLEGRAVAFPAPSGGGKSTLVAACLLAGFDYVSDEALCVEFGSAEVVPYPKPLRLSAWSLRRLELLDSPFSVGAQGEALVTAERDLGGRLASRPLSLHAVVLPEPGPGPSRLTEMGRAEIVSRLLRYSFNHYKKPRPAFWLAVSLARRCRAWRLSYSDPLEAAALLAQSFS